MGSRRTDGRAVPATLAIGSALAFVLSPFALLAVGGLPPMPWWRLLAMSCGLVATLVVIWRSRLWRWLAALPAVLVSFWLAMGLYYPCWKYSNARWCGHLCDDDPCSCPERSGYGQGSGCQD